MEPLDLIKLQIGLEYQLDEGGLLVPIHGSSEKAWYIIYHYANAFTEYFGRELPDKVRQQLAGLGTQINFYYPENVKELISMHYQTCRGGEDVYWSGYFTHPPESHEYQATTQEGEDWVIVQDGQAASRALSIRQNEKCAEVYVETLPSYRRRGYGRQVVAAWAQAILNSGRVPFYSYRMGNRPSATLASSLGVVWFAYVLAFEPGL